MVPPPDRAIIAHNLCMLSPGDEIGGHTIEAIAGRGGMAITFRARRGRDGRTVAVKVPRPSLLADPTYALRFLQEAHLGSRLNSPNIARIFEAGDADGVPWLSMEFLEGMTLGDLLRTSGRLSVRRALNVTRDIAAALEHAHGRGVIHRDLKPDNVMLCHGSPLKVMDFGVAKVVGSAALTTSNLFIGSPRYAAPETGDAKRVDHRADLYSLGVMLFEMLQGRAPYEGRSAVEVMLAHRELPLPSLEELPVDVEPGIWRLVEQLLDKDRDRRSGDARAVRIAMEMLLRR